MKKRNGFSLMELMIVIAIIGIISAISVPSLLSMRDRYKLRASATDIMSAIKRTQTEAVKRGVRAAVAMNTAIGLCTIFVDDGNGGGVASNKIQDGTELSVSTYRVQNGVSLQDDADTALAPSFPSDITISGTAYRGVEFNSGGIPTNLPSGTLAYIKNCPLPAPQTTGIFSAINIVGTSNPTIQYQVLVNVFTGRTKLMTSTNSGGCFQ